MTQEYNVGGRTFATYTRSSDDPCGYVTDTPCNILSLINESVTNSLTRTVKVAEYDKTAAAVAWRKHNLIREMAIRAGNAGDVQTRRLMLARIRKVSE